MPDWRSPVDYAIFDRLFGDDVKRRGGSIDHIAWAFARNVYLVGRWRGDAPTGSALPAADLPDWPGLFGNMVRYVVDAPEPSRRMRSLREWVLSWAALLAAPESSQGCDRQRDPFRMAILSLGFGLRRRWELPIATAETTRSA